jgi:transposase-like protein
MSPDELTKRLEQSRLSTRELARQLGLASRTPARWRLGYEKIPAHHVARIRELTGDAPASQPIAAENAQAPTTNPPRKTSGLLAQFTAKAGHASQRRQAHFEPNYPRTPRQQPPFDPARGPLHSDFVISHNAGKHKLFPPLGVWLQR